MGSTSSFGASSLERPFAIGSESLLEHMYKKIKLDGAHRRFLVTRLGGTGSTWFAKALNSHPEVWCSHEGILPFVFPRTSYDQYDIGCFTQQLAADLMHEAYAAAGDIGSVWLGPLRFLPPAISTALLVRHPLRMLGTNMRYAKENVEVPVPAADIPPLERAFKVNAADLDALDLRFLQLADTWVRTFLLAHERGAAQQVIRLEDLSDVEQFREIAFKLTGVDYPGDLVRQLIARRVNVGVQSTTPAEILASWPQQWQSWYRSVVEAVAEKAGY